jgi:hypothetical protein
MSCLGRRVWSRSGPGRDGLSGGLDRAKMGRRLGDGPVGETAEGGHQLLGPRPSLRDTQRGASTGADQHTGGVEEAVAESFGFGPGQLAFEAQASHLGEEIAGEEDDGHPGLVDGEIGRGQVGQPGVLGVADVALAASAAAIDALQIADVGIGQVSEENLVAVPVNIGEAELGAGMGILSSGVPGSRSASPTGRPDR